MLGEGDSHSSLTQHTIHYSRSVELGWLNHQCTTFTSCAAFLLTTVCSSRGPPAMTTWSNSSRLSVRSSAPRSSTNPTDGRKELVLFSLTAQKTRRLPSVSQSPTLDEKASNSRHSEILWLHVRRPPPWLDLCQVHQCQWQRNGRPRSHWRIDTRPNDVRSLLANPHMDTTSCCDVLFFTLAFNNTLLPCI